jgi:hypothetical protein
MTEGFVCWMCNENEQQERSPYCAECEQLHDLDLLQSPGDDIREWGKLGEKLMGEWDSYDLPFSDETSVTA